MPQMDPQRWRAASRRLDEALELGAQERAQWLTTLGEQDPTLASDVGMLLQEYDVIQRERFLEEGVEFRPEASADEQADQGAPPAPASRTIGAYRLVSPIGQGGMGVVWLAERCDGQFEARVAIKLLDIRFGRSEARFRREANILARLTHPNIAHLIDAGVTSDSQPYLVLELVEGQPIDRYCDERRLDVRARVQLFLDVLAAVAHAHTHRIVHRDLKPPNVLVRTDGHVKLLDFGIAKLLQADSDEGVPSTVTLEGGGALTPAYAAPEQVRGGAVTAATDVYALGVLLYVLLTGQHPCGDVTSPADLMKAIVEVDAPAPSAAAITGKEPDPDPATRAANRATTPARLQRQLQGDLDTIVAKTLKKEPAERYASVADLADDLRRHLASEPIRARRDSLQRRSARFVRRHPSLTTAAAIGALAIVGATTYYLVRPPDPAPGAVSDAQAPAPLTSEPGDERWPSLSPDGSRIAFSWLAPGAAGGRIAVKALGSDTVVQLTEGAADEATPVWSPDGQQIAFVRTLREREAHWQICLIPASGGPLRVLHTMSSSTPGLAWWPAGNALVFPTRVSRTDPFRLAALDLATLGVRFLTAAPTAADVAAPGDFSPAVAPDGRRVAFLRETKEGRDVYVLDPANGVERRLTHDRHRISGLTWAPSGDALIMSSPRSGVETLYRVSLADGSMVRVANSGDGAVHPMANQYGLVYSQANDDSNIYRAELRDGRAAGPPRAVIASTRGDGAPHISPDGRSIAFTSMRGGGAEIWVVAADGSGPRRVNSLPISSAPRWSPDGRSIAFGALAPGVVRPDIWIVDATGGTPRRLTTDPSYETLLSWAADGRSLYVMSDRTGDWEVWSIPIDGGAATRITEGGGLRAQESADGKFLYYANDVPEVWRRSLRAPEKADELITTLTGAHWGGDWLLGARGIYYLNEQTAGAVGIDFLPFDEPRRTVRVLSLTAPGRGFSTFAVAPDETWLAWAQEDYRNSDVMMIAYR
jgi:Tol biopolymer transport system component/serine/threonine protein kinase